MRLYVVTILWQKQTSIPGGQNISTSSSTVAIWSSSEGEAFASAYEKKKPEFNDYGMEGKTVFDITELASQKPTEAGQPNN